MQANLSDYGYVNARIRGMKSHLLGRNFYEQLIKLEDLYSMITELEKTPYKKELDECVAREQVEPGDIDEALKRNLARTFRKVLSFMAGEPRKLTGILLARWDLHNVKSILRGKHIGAAGDPARQLSPRPGGTMAAMGAVVAGATEEEIYKSLIPAGEVDIPFLAELAKQPDVKSVVDLIVTWDLPYAKPLRKSLPKYLEAMRRKKFVEAEDLAETVEQTPIEIESLERNLAILETALEKSYYSFALKNTSENSLNSRIVRALVVSQIDITNIVTLLQI